MQLYYRVSFEQLFPVLMPRSTEIHLSPSPLMGRNSTGTVCGGVAIASTDEQVRARCPICFKAVVEGVPRVVTDEPSYD